MKNDNNFDEKKHALATNFGRNHSFFREIIYGKIHKMLRIVAKYVSHPKGAHLYL